MAVGDLLQPADAEEEVVHVQELIEEVGKFISLLLPTLDQIGDQRHGAKGRSDFGLAR